MTRAAPPIAAAAHFPSTEAMRKFEKENPQKKNIFPVRIPQNKVDLVLAKAAALRINLNLDGSPIASKSHTHPSHSQTSRLLTSSLPLGVPVPRPTQCV
jgi:hypothetical protein